MPAAEDLGTMYVGNIVWTQDGDPERPGFKIWTGAPVGLPQHRIIVQDVGDDEWGWLLMDGETTPVQMRNGYANADLAKNGAALWLKANPEA